MKRILQIIIIILIIFFVVKIFSPRQPSSVIIDSDKLNSTTSSEVVTSSSGKIYINKNVWPVEIAVTEAQKVNGLSNRQTLRAQEGMPFVFSKPEFQFFWMKDMLIDLDMIFFDENWKIVLIEKNLSGKSFPKTFGGDIKSKFVLEINAGEANSFGLQVGDQAIFINE